MAVFWPAACPRGLRLLLGVVLGVAAAAAHPATGGAQSASPRRPAPSVATEKAPIWQGCTGTVCVRWTEDDIVATSPANPAAPFFSLAAQLRAAFEQDQRHQREEDEAVARERSTRGEPPPDPNPCTQEVHAGILSFVGSLLSIQTTVSTYCERAAHPAGETSFVTFDLAQSVSSGASPAPRPKRVRLGDLFAPEPVIAAFRSDPLIGRAIAGTGPDPKTLQALQEAMGAAPEMIEAKNCYAFAGDQLARFAFHHLDGDQVAVRVGLPGAGPCRENLTQIGLLLPIPAPLASALASADAGESGFLMRSAREVARGRSMMARFLPLP